MPNGLSNSKQLKRKSTNLNHIGRDVRHKRNIYFDDEAEIGGSGSEHDISDRDSEEEALSTDESFVLKPFWIMSRWSGPETLTKRITICIQLTCGCSKDDYIINVSDDGMVLEVLVSWPSPE